MYVEIHYYKNFSKYSSIIRKKLSEFLGHPTCEGYGDSAPGIRVWPGRFLLGKPEGVQNLVGLRFFLDMPNAFFFVFLEFNYFFFT